MVSNEIGRQYPPLMRDAEAFYRHALQTLIARYWLLLPHCPRPASVRPVAAQRGEHSGRKEHTLCVRCGLNKKTAAGLLFAVAVAAGAGLRGVLLLLLLLLILLLSGLRGHDVAAMRRLGGLGVVRSGR